MKTCGKGYDVTERQSRGARDRVGGSGLSLRPLVFTRISVRLFAASEPEAGVSGTTTKAALSTQNRVSYG